MTPVERLQKGWCKGRYAYDDRGTPVYPENPKACKWCLLGAGLWSGMSSDDSWFIACSHALPDCRNLAKWNDSPERTLDEVIEVAQQAMNYLEAAKEAKRG